MAAYVSKLNASAFCIGAHTATAARAYRDGQRVSAVLADLDSAPIEEGLRATLQMLGKLTKMGSLDADDIRVVLSAGVSHQQIADSLAVNFAFNVTDRLANAFAFEVLNQEGFEAGAKYLLKRGYR
jgi:AhpD family alkylhydroperoxidase